MTRFLKSIVMIFVFAGCKTVEVPLGGVMVGRPHTMGSQFGIRATSGLAQEPKVQGVVDEVKDSEGNIVNPIASESTQDARLSMPVFELGLGFAKYFELGLSTNRGLNGMVDLYRGPVGAISLSAATMDNSLKISKHDKSKDDPSKASETDKTKEPIDDLSARSKNTNVTLLTSARFGDQVWGQFSIYGGVGANQFTVEVSDLDTKETAKKSQIAPSALVGMQAKAAIFEVSAEAAMIKIRERNGKDKVIPLGLLTSTLRFDYFGSGSSSSK